MMKEELTRIQNWGAKRPEFIICLFIFLTSAFIFLANREIRTSNDNIPHTLIALNWLINHSLNFDAFRNSHFYRLDGTIPYFFAEAPNGHLTSTYPIGTAILTFPLYFLFFIYLKLNVFFQSFTATPISLDITTPEFDTYRLIFSKLAATITTSLSLVFFYLVLRFKFTPFVSLVATFIFAFATSTWVISSQGLWQHTALNMAVLSILLALLKANRVSGAQQKILLVVAGIFCGLLPGIRTTSLLYAIAAILYSIFAFRKNAIFIFLGLSSLLINACWNFYYFGFGISNFIVGGYSRFSDNSSSEFTSQFYVFNWQQFLEGFSGLLVSPSRGILVFSPIVLFAIPGIYFLFKARAGKDEKLIICLGFAAILIFIQYCFFTVWSGGSGFFSPRYLVDILPILCVALAYSISALFHSFLTQRKPISVLFVSVFMLLTIYSTGVQAIGAFGSTFWGTVPLPPTVDRNKFWSWSDSQIERFASNLVYKVIDPIQDAPAYVKGLEGTIEQIQNQDGQPVTSGMLVPPRKPQIFKALLRNTGSVQWYGYETGMLRGETRVKVQLLDSNNQPVRTRFSNILYVSGLPKPGESAEAIGAITFPNKPGEYRLVFSLFVQGLGEFPGNADQPPYTLMVQVKN